MASRGGGGDNTGGFLLFIVIIVLFGVGWMVDIRDVITGTDTDDVADTVEEVVDGAVTAGSDVLGSDPVGQIGDALNDPLNDAVAGDTTTNPAPVPGSDSDGVADHAPAPSPLVPFPTPGPGDYNDAIGRLETAVIEPAGSTAKYDRDTWTPNGWSPVPGVPAGQPPLAPRCDVRETLFKLWAVNESHTARPDCYPTGVVIVDGYTGNTWTLPNDRAFSTIDGEHVIALFEAHNSGGDAWTTVQRNTFASDYTIRSYADGGTQLFLADNRENQTAKAEYDIGGYLPAAEESRCGFVVNAVAVKHRYQLSFDAEEVAAAVDAIEACQAGQVPDRP